MARAVKLRTFLGLFRSLKALPREQPDPPFSREEGKVLALCIAIFLLSEIMRFMGAWPDGTAAYATHYTTIAVVIGVSVIHAQSRASIFRSFTSQASHPTSLVVAGSVVLAYALLFPLSVWLLEDQIDRLPIFLWPALDTRWLTAMELTVGLFLTA